MGRSIRSLADEHRTRLRALVEACDLDGLNALTISLALDDGVLASEVVAYVTEVVEHAEPDIRDFWLPVPKGLR